MSLLGWLQDLVWPIRTWYSLQVSGSMPRTCLSPVRQVAHPDELLPVLDLLARRYKPDPFNGALDFSYDPRLIQWAIDNNRWDLLAGLDCDDAAYVLWASLWSIATDVALVVLIDRPGGKCSHAVLAFTWAGKRWVMDYTGRHELVGTVLQVYAPLIPAAAFEAERWYRSYPFPDPRKVA